MQSEWKNEIVEILEKRAACCLNRILRGWISAEISFLFFTGIAINEKVAVPEIHIRKVKK